MKLTSPSKLLIDALSIAEQAVNSKATMPQLTCAKFDCERDVVTITCDSLDACVSVRVEGCTVDEPFAFLASPRLMKASLRGDEATITFKDDKLQIVSGGKSTMATLPVKEFAPIRANIDAHEIDGRRFLAALKAAANCTGGAPDSIESCVCWDKELSNVFGTNRTMLHTRTMDLGLTDSIIMPRPSVTLISSIFGDGEGMSIGLGKGVLHVSKGDVSAWVGLREGGMLPYRLLISDSPAIGTINREGLLSALSALEPFTDPTFGKIGIEATDGAWNITASHNGNESSAQVDGADGSDVEKFYTSLRMLEKAVKTWEAEKVSVSNEGKMLLRPMDDSGCVAVVCVIRG